MSALNAGVRKTGRFRSRYLRRMPRDPVCMPRSCAADCASRHPGRPAVVLSCSAPLAVAASRHRDIRNPVSVIMQVPPDTGPKEGNGNHAKSRICANASVNGTRLPRGSRPTHIRFPRAIVRRCCFRAIAKQSHCCHDPFMPVGMTSAATWLGSAHLRLGAMCRAAKGPIKSLSQR